MYSLCHSMNIWNQQVWLYKATDVKAADEYVFQILFLFVWYMYRQQDKYIICTFSWIFHKLRFLISFHNDIHVAFYMLVIIFFVLSAVIFCLLLEMKICACLISKAIFICLNDWSSGLFLYWFVQSFVHKNESGLTSCNVQCKEDIFSVFFFSSSLYHLFVFVWPDPVIHLK